LWRIPTIAIACLFVLASLPKSLIDATADTISPVDVSGAPDCRNVLESGLLSATFAISRNRPESSADCPYAAQMPLMVLESHSFKNRNPLFHLPQGRLHGLRRRAFVVTTLMPLAVCNVECVIAG
jgi:hypothetical protein